MAFVTDDKRVKKIIDEIKAGKSSLAQGGQRIRDLPPQEDAEYGYLDWEVDLALSKLA